MRHSSVLWVTLLIAIPAGMIDAAETHGPTRAEVEAMMGLPSNGDRVRGQMDTVGFAVDAHQAEEVVSTALRLERENLAEQDRRLGMGPDDGFLGGICPHDDHLYASRVYVHLSERITAPRILLVGVFHRAKSWALEDRIVFDRFEAWHGPWGEIEVDPLRGELIQALSPESLVVDNAMHCREHSLEALLPFLQKGHLDRRIVPILVPHMGWQRIEALSDELARVLATIMDNRGWRLGRDIAVVISSDAVHYGPDFDHAPFGTDATAYQQAVSRDRQLVGEYLAGPLNAGKLRALFDALVDPTTLDYRLPWCGRFSVPFGLELLRKVSLATEGRVPKGALLRYGTSLSDPELPVSQSVRSAGLGYTAPSNFHHWVGYAAVGYRLSGREPDQPWGVRTTVTNDNHSIH
jgi:AmmeMemoRadiSam system protein B